MSSFKSIIKHLKTLNTGFIVAASFLVLLGIIILVTPLTLLGAGEGATSAVSGQSAGFAFLAAGLSISVSVIGAGIALSRIGAAAMAALAEKPEIMGSAIVFAGLAEGLSIWGLIVAVLILGKI
ncbi:MAG: ATPase [Candidatus Stahlbacteria bacterium]|nr:MAG: ATPase [Candidatus Stahlbacteria bacterium]